MAEKRDFNYYQHSEAKTGYGQLVKFTAHPDDVDQVKQNLQLVRTITTPPTHKINVPHGGYGRYSRFDVQHLTLTGFNHEGKPQRAYAGGRGGYIEALQINDAPDGRVQTVLHEYEGAVGAHFVEFAT